MVSRELWQDYLKSVCAEHAKWWDRFAPIDASREETRCRDLFDLMAEAFKERAQRPERGQRKEERKFGEPRRESVEKLGVVEGLRKYANEHVLLVGRPGSGKTTSLARLFLEEAEAASRDPKKRIPVLLELKHYQETPMNLIRRSLGQHGLELIEDEANRLLDEGRFLLLFDGLNELPSEDSRRAVSSFRSLHPKTPMAFTTRELGGAFDLGIERRLDMLPLTEPQLKQFVEAYLPGRSEAFVRKLRDRVKELARTPLFLWMLCALFKGTEEMPENLGLVFRTFAEQYQKTVKHGAPVKEESRDSWEQALQQLAFKMLQADSPTELRLVVDGKQGKDILGRFIADSGLAGKIDAAELLRDLINHHLIQRASDNAIEFRHQLIQEYYAAEQLLTIVLTLDDETLKREYLNYLKWTEPLALMLELVDNKEQALRIVRLALDVDLMLGARLAGSVRREFQDESVKLVTGLDLHLPLIIDLLERTHSEAALAPLSMSLEGEDSDLRRSAANALGEIGTEAAVPPLVRALNDKNGMVRESAVEALGEIGTEAAVTPLLQALKDQDFCVRSSAAGALGKIGTEAALTPLLQALKDGDRSVRRQAAYALGEIGTEAAVKALLQALKDEVSYVRRQAAYALGEIGTEAAVKALLQALKDGNWYVVRSAADALGKIGTEAAVKALLQALKDEDWCARSMAAYALGEIGTEAAVKPLLQALKDEDWHVVRSAAGALDKIGTEAAVKPLLQALKDEDQQIREEAARALGRIGTEAAVTPLLQALKDEELFVRCSAGEALAEIGTESALTALLEALKDEGRDVRMQAALALGRIGTEAVVTPLLQALKDQDRFVRSMAADALGKIGTEAAVTPLLQALKDEDSAVRWSSAEALGRIGDEAAVTPLLQALKDEDWVVRSRAAYALGEIGSESALTALLQALKDENSAVRSSAAYALGEVGSESAVTPLLQALRDKDWHVRSSAADALGEIGSEAAVMPLLQALEDGDSDVRHTAVHVLARIGTEAALTPLLQALKTQEWSVRDRAADALAETGNPRALSLLETWMRTGQDYSLARDAIPAIQQKCWYYSHNLHTRKDKSMSILHLSDLHFTTAKRADLWFSQLQLDLTKELNCEQLDAIVISGDVGTLSTGNEYAEAERFFKKLTQRFGVGPNRVVIVPGNHDVNYKLVAGASSAGPRPSAQPDPNLPRRGLDHFARFYHAITGTSYSMTPSKQVTLRHIPELGVVFLGLNSAWQIDKSNEDGSDICVEALGLALSAMSEKRDQYKECLKIGVWHHPVTIASDGYIKEDGFLELLALEGFRLVLHGHIHGAQDQLWKYDAKQGGRRIEVLAAGTFGVKTENLPPTVPWQYSLITVEKAKVKVQARKRTKKNGAWKPDARWLQGAGENPLPYYEFDL